MSTPEKYWSEMNPKRKRLVLLWIYILKTEPFKAITEDFLEPRFIDADPCIRTHQIPDYIFMMNPAQLTRELDKTGEFPKWIQ